MRSGGQDVCAQSAGSSVLGCFSVTSFSTVTSVAVFQMGDDFAVDVGLRRAHSLRLVSITAVSFA